jgi:hypothetical protein
MHVKATYDRHWDLLELLELITDALIIERLGRGGPQHISSFWEMEKQSARHPEG